MTEETISREELRREVGCLRELIEVTLAEREHALDLQRDEYHRRLDELNNAHERALQAQRDTVPREVFDRFVSGFDGWKVTVIRDLAAAQGNAATSARYFANIVIIMSLVFAAITVGLTAFKP